MRTGRVIAVDNRNGGIEAILGRLDRLLDEMAEVPSAGAAATAAMLDAARRERSARRERQRLFGAILLSEPSWDMLIDLFIAGEEGRQMSLRGLCRDSSMAESVALRCIAHLVEERLVARQSQPDGDRNSLLALTEQGRSGMCDYFNRSMAADEGGAGA